jgi:hypothetical protein
MLARMTAMLLGQQQNQQLEREREKFRDPLQGMPNTANRLPSLAEPPSGMMVPTGGPEQLPPLNVTAPAPMAPRPQLPGIQAPPDATAAPPMPAPVQVGGNPMQQQLMQMAQNGTLPDIYKEMFPEWAGGSLTQGRG